MAKQKESGCALLAICLAVLFVAKKCSGGPSVTSESEAAETRYVSASSLNCRSAPSRSGKIVTKLPFALVVVVKQESAGWAEVSGNGATCWALAEHLSTSYPVRAEPKPMYQARRRLQSEPRRIRSEPSRQCGSKRTCGEMDSCSEANFYLDQCGMSRLDRDGDGVPCESICG